MNHRRTALAATLLALAHARRGVAQPAADAFPQRPVRIVVPFAPGGSTDVVARILGKRLSELLQQSVLIDNRPGANTVIGTEHVAKSAPDGYTLVMATNNHTSNVSMYRKLPYDTGRAFAPVVLVGSTPNVIAVNPKLPSRSLAELLDAARANPGGIGFATAGHGTTQHFTGELLNQLAGTRMNHVGYKGGGPAATDVIAGHVPVLISGLPPAMPFIKSGALLPLAVTSTRRSPILPDVPTVAESGHPGFDATFWFAILAPAGTPQPVLARLNAAFNDTLQDAEVRRLLGAQGVDIAGGTAAQAQDFLDTDTRKWAELIRASGIKLLD